MEEHILTSFFSTDEINHAYTKTNTKNVAFYLLQQNPVRELTVHEKRASIILFPDHMEQYKYRALLQYGFFHNEIIDSLLRLESDFDELLMYLLKLKLHRRPHMQILQCLFGNAEIIQSLEEVNEWSDLPYRLMCTTAPFVAKTHKLDACNTQYIESFEKDNTIRFYDCLLNFGFESSEIIHAWSRKRDWNIVPYVLFRRKIRKQKQLCE